MYGVKCTFNLNSGLLSQIKYRDGINNSRLGINEIEKIYKGHEIASHSLYHFHMENLTYEENKYQIKEDINNLKKIFNTEIKGFAFPFGTYNKNTLIALKESNIMYARTTKPSYSFYVNVDKLLEFNPTCSHSDKMLNKLAIEFLTTNVELALFYVWGHTYEFENNNNWNLLKMLLEILKDDKDIAYLTNIDAFKYICETKKVELNDEYLINNSSIDIYVKVDGVDIVLKSKEKVYIKEINI